MKTLPASILAGCLLVGWTEATAIAGDTATNEASGRAKEAPHAIRGKLRSVDGARLAIETRKGEVVQVDAGPALKARRSAPLVAGHTYEVKGTYDAHKVMLAEAIQRVKASPATWPADR